MTYQVIIPMTGVGQRFIDAGYQNLKPLICVDGKPIIDHVLSMYQNAQKVICIISADHPQKSSLVSEILRVRPGAIIREIKAHKLGPGHAILQAYEDIDSDLPTLVSYCDWAGIWKVDEMIHQLKHLSGSILTYTGFHPHMMRSTKFAYVKKIEDMVVDIQEKESYTNEPMNEEASSGCYGFSSGSLLLEALKSQIDDEESLNGEYYISLTYKNVLRKGHKVGTVQMKKFYQWGTPEDLQDWEYWNNTVRALPGLAKEDLKVDNVILAAGRGARIAEFAQESKPNILISGQHLWEYSAPTGIQFESNRVVTREEVGLSLRSEIEVVTVPSVTEGQAITAKIGIENINEDSPFAVNVMSSDNAFTPENFSKVTEVADINEITVWTSKSYPMSRLNPSQYAWINVKEKKVIKKATPPNFLEWELITGNFSFNNRKLALRLINELVQRNIRVNGEFYLDSVIELAFEKNMNVGTVEIDNFIAIGTPEELRTYKYFQSFE